MARLQRPPAYRHRSIRGRDVAYVRLFDQDTRKIRDYWLGEFGSAESREKFARILAEWESRGRRLSRAQIDRSSAHGPTVSQVCHAFREEVVPRYVPGEQRAFEMAIRLLRRMFGETPAASFGPNALRLVRQSMLIADQGGRRPRIAWSRSTTNHMVGRIRMIFKWAASREFLPVTVYQSLRTLEPLRRGCTDVREGRRVLPADLNHVVAVRKAVAPPVAAMINLQLLTGMRSGEVCRIRPCDINMSGKVWSYEPREHKTSYHGKQRTIYLGPKAQEIIKRFLAGKATDSFIFSPCEAVDWHRTSRHAARKTPLSSGNRPGTNCKTEPTRSPGAGYDTASYRRAIDYGCAKAGVPHWHPHQLRHNYATDIRKKYGLEAAQILLGHSSALVTEAVYAERDMEKAQQIAQVIG